MLRFGGFHFVVAEVSENFSEDCSDLQVQVQPGQDTIEDESIRRRLNAMREGIASKYKRKTAITIGDFAWLGVWLPRRMDTRTFFLRFLGLTIRNLDVQS